MIAIKQLGFRDYAATWQLMQEFTNERSIHTIDELWLLQHNPVFTFGLAGRSEHLLNLNHDIPVVKSDRGGQITYHGPGQIVIYTLLDLRRLNLSIRVLVEKLEQGIINYLATFGINAYGDRCAPGVYVANKKIASLGLKVRRGCTYHGISFNFDMDLTPFSYINVCGYSGLQVTQLRDLLLPDEFSKFDVNHIAKQLAMHLTQSIYPI